MVITGWSGPDRIYGDSGCRGKIDAGFQGGRILHWKVQKLYGGELNLFLKEPILARCA
jgi:hypothetical protein